MPNQTPEHMQRLAGVPVSRRRATKIARLIETAPLLEADQVRYLRSAQQPPDQGRCAMTEASAGDVRAQKEQAQLEKVVQRIIDAAPPLTPEQRDRLAVLLRGAAS